MAKVHRVRDGECISSIADDYGFFPATIWNHDNNAKLRELRDPNVLHAGDEVFIPDREIKTETGATDKRHTFTRKGVPAKFRIQICNATKPRAKLPYKLVIDDSLTLEGETDDQGVIDVHIPPKARVGRLELNGGEQVMDVLFGRLAPVEEEQGARQRLFNLGLLRKLDGGEKELAAAVRLFQRKFELEVTGELDTATQAKLVEIHESRETGST
jgi:hypothetical protein